MPVPSEHPHATWSHNTAETPHNAEKRPLIYLTACVPYLTKISVSHRHPQGRLCHVAEQLSLQDVLSFLVLLSRLERFVVLPAYRLVALSTGNIPHDVSARSHVPLAGIARRDVDDVVEQVRLAMLAPEVLIQHVSNGSQAWQGEGGNEQPDVLGL